MSAENPLNSFQSQVGNLLLRHRSFLDTTSKFQESNARVTRAIMKSVTECGCLKVEAERQPFEKESNLDDWKNNGKTHLSGQLCDHCQDIIKAEMGKNLFYLTGLCNLLDIGLVDVLKQECDQLSTLGVFNLR